MATAVIVAVVGIAAAIIISHSLVFSLPATPFHRAAYILESNVTHSRLQPKASAHSFTYPTLFLLVSLNALESQSLDLGRGWLFGYERKLRSLTGLRSSAYLNEASHDNTSIKAKLLCALTANGFDGQLLCDAWMMTMPSYFMFEGINPLTMYFCYKSCDLWLVVLEVHNTFGERHVYILEIGNAEDQHPAPGFQHQWTFSRDFHVSPFNDRSGFYTVSIKGPSHAPPGVYATATTAVAPPRPLVRIHLHSVDPRLGIASMPPKLTAFLRPRHSSPLNSSNLLRAIAYQPFVLLLSFARILYQAWILHYHKRLDVYARPDPKPALPNWGGLGLIADSSKVSGGTVGWQAEGLLDTYSRCHVEAFLSRRACDTGIHITLIAANPKISPRVFAASHKEAEDDSDRCSLTIWYLSPQFFTTLFLAPSLAHGMLLGHKTERLFVPSSVALCDRVFSTDGSSRQNTASRMSLAQCLRVRSLPPELLQSPEYLVPHDHPMDPDRTHSLRTIRNMACISMHLALNCIEEGIYKIVRARFVQGQEPWKRWERARDMLHETSLGAAGS